MVLRAGLLAEKTFFFIDWLTMQVFNGGWEQWYHNWPEAERRQRIEETIEALEVIDAADTIALVQRAVAILDQSKGVYDERLSALDESLWEQPDDLARLIQDWARERIDQFAVEPPER